MTQFVDSHCHIDGPEFDADREDVIARAVDVGVTTMLNVATGDPHSGAFERAVELSEKHASVYGAIGVHPSIVLRVLASRNRVQESSPRPNRRLRVRCSWESATPNVRP